MANARLLTFLLLGRDAMIKESYETKAFNLSLLVTESSRVHGYKSGETRLEAGITLGPGLCLSSYISRKQPRVWGRDSLGMARALKASKPTPSSKTPLLSHTSQSFPNSPRLQNSGSDICSYWGHSHSDHHSLHL